MITVAQFAKKIGLSSERVRVLIRQKRIKAVMYGKTYLILSEKIMPPKYKGRPPKH